jgi:hypothetical protein
MLVARPEDEILICVARRSLDGAMAERLRRLLQSDLDWKYLLASAERHCVVPLLHRHVSETTAAAVPAQMLNELRAANHENTDSNFLLTGELLKILSFLKANDVQAIPFKGPTLAIQAYGDVGLRQFGDLDILVRKTDVTKVLELLVDRGFQPQPELTPARAAALVRFDCACNFTNQQGIALDVHWDFVERHWSFDIDTNSFWNRLKPVTLASQQLLTLSTADLLLVLCLHGFTHFWERLGWICDVASLIDQQKDIDWQLVLQNANRLGCQRILSLGLLLATELLEAPLPPEVLERVKADLKVRKLARQVQEQLFVERRAPEGLFDSARLFLNVRERKRDRLRSCLSLAATPRSYDWMFLSLPDSLFFLYYLIRPLRLVGKYGAKLLKGSNDQASPATRT